MLEIRSITADNLPDAVRLCLSGKTFGDRPRAFTRDVETECARCKLALVRDRQMSGGAAFAAYQHGLLVGYAELHTVRDALAPLDGKSGHVLQCLRVPEYGVRETVEKALVEHAFEELGGRGGIAVLAREKDWSGLGFSEAARSCGEVISDDRVLWWRGEGAAPRVIDPERDFALVNGKVRVDLFTSARCPWDLFVADLVRSAAAAMTDDVVLFETDCSTRRAVKRAGVVSAVAINGTYMPWYRPHTLPDEHAIRRAFEDVA